MHIEIGNFPYSDIGPKIKHSEIENRVFRRISNQLIGHPLADTIDSIYWFPRYLLAAKPRPGRGKEPIFEIDELDKNEKYDITVIVSITLNPGYLIKADVRLIGSLVYGHNDWIMEAKSWEHNIACLQTSPLCKELLFHSRDFSQGVKPGHSNKTPWHHQWDVTTKSKIPNTNEHHFIWRPHFWEKPKDGSYDGRSWTYKDKSMDIIPEFQLKKFFDTCHSFCTSGIKRDQTYYAAL